MTTKLAQLKAMLADIYHLERIGQMLEWDHQVYMPPGGAEARTHQMAALTQITHQKATSPELGGLLSAAEDEGAEGDDAALLRMARRDYDRMTRVPTELMTERSKVTTQAHHVWQQAREENDYPRFAPWLARILELTRQIADHLGYEDSIYDPLLDYFEPGMKTAQVRAIFDNLKTDLAPLAQAALARVDAVNDEMLYGDFDPAKQRIFGEEIVRDFGFDFTRGRQDESVHPFTVGIAPGDTRITTRFDPGWLSPALFATLHEAGHAMYEQGFSEQLGGNILSSHASLGVHESQSRLWENIVGRSLGFWRHYFPRLQQLFPDQFAIVDAEAFYRAVNRVSPSFIRVEADELTYDLHIILRFEMELALLTGELSVDDAPAAWDDRFEALLGTRPPDDAHGILQDVHWSGGSIGYFPTYTLGNLLAAQLYDKAVQEEPDIPAQIAQGAFGTLLGWMREHIHTHGRTYLPVELIEKATGTPLRSDAYIAYLSEKYGAIYGL